MWDQWVLAEADGCSPAESAGAAGQTHELREHEPWSWVQVGG